MDTILYDALNNSLGAVFASVARAGLVLATGLFIGCAVLFVVFAWPRKETQETPASEDAPDMPLVDTSGALAALPPTVAAWLIADTNAAWSARQQREEGNGHE